MLRTNPHLYKPDLAATHRKAAGQPQQHGDVNGRSRRSRMFGGRAEPPLAADLEKCADGYRISPELPCELVDV
jgi:hypothetical protein